MKVHKYVVGNTGLNLEGLDEKAGVDQSVLVLKGIAYKLGANH